jgi:tRNA A37 threonylcarbamoyladenosine dehydratase
MGMNYNTVEFLKKSDIIKIRVFNKKISTLAKYHPEKVEIVKDGLFKKKTETTPAYFRLYNCGEVSKEFLLEKNRFVIDNENNVYDKPQVVIYIKDNNPIYKYFDKFINAEEWAQDFVSDNNLSEFVSIEY